jgi:hypothetical protein
MMRRIVAATRFVFWVRRSGGDRSQPLVVRYDIAGHGTGFYTRYRGDRAVALYRYDRRHSGFPRGAVLVPGTRWGPTESPDRTIALGSDDPGDPIDRTQAAEIAVELGHPVDVLEEPA